jgi:predicted PolB exonuclease-like 3'-5' exonuclease
MYKNGELEKIERYCFEDVMGTYIVWLHLKFTSGDISRKIFSNLKERAIGKLNEIQGEDNPSEEE